LIPGYAARVPLIALALVVLIPIAFLLATPWLLVQRFRAGTKRKPARGWVATANVAGVLFSASVFLFAAAITNIWVPHAFGYSVSGIGVGALLGLLGLAFTRWERNTDALHYTPNRWLVLLITAAIAARLLYGLSRAWQAWRADTDGTSWVVAAGVAGSMAVGAAVIGYYAMYAVGVWWQVRRHRKRPPRWSIREVT
jgi:hypothetical protein